MLGRVEEIKDIDIYNTICAIKTWICCWTCESAWAFTIQFVLLKQQGRILWHKKIYIYNTICAIKTENKNGTFEIKMHLQYNLCY